MCRGSIDSFVCARLCFFFVLEMHAVSVVVYCSCVFRVFYAEVALAKNVFFMNGSLLSVRCKEGFWWRNVK